jgi:hypothetical protein
MLLIVRVFSTNIMPLTKMYLIIIEREKQQKII